MISGSGSANASAGFSDQNMWISPSAEELTVAMRASGVLANSGRVSRATAVPVGNGQLAQSFLVMLEYDGISIGPQSAFVKLPPLDPNSASTAASIGAFEREIFFYRELRPTLDVCAPRLLGVIERSEGALGLVLDDLSTITRPLDQLADGTIDQAQSVVSQLAGLQAAYWNDLGRAGGVSHFYNRTDDDHIASLAERYTRSWDIYGTRIAANLTPAQQKIIEDFGPRVCAWASGITGPRTLVHQDLRLDNLLWDGKRVWLIDWQTMAWASPAWDLSFYLGSALEPPERRAVEVELVAEHVRCLQELGVANWDFETAWQEYRRLSGALILAMVAALGFVQSTARGFDMFTSLLGRGAQHALDHDLLSFT